ncbi:hypothetical protein QCA50_011654 [Cerrena zonata]|uniref:Uncharacterized protein n=1 Tax=Cerrena zonata TaxID=2478898 RepID=A0AAW0G6J9_9APHY
MADLPELLDPLLDFLSDRLPPPVYSILETILSHTIQLLSSLFALATSLVTSNPSTWDAEKILPPLITLLISYLALVSFYRTTGWMIRTAFAFVKWGFIFSILGGLAGYVLANGNGYGGNGIGGMFAAGGIVPAIGGMILNMLNGNTNDRGSSGNSRGTRSSRSRTQTKPGSKPKAWDTWDQHQQWQYNANDQNQGSPPDVQQVMSEILGATTKAVKESGWWEAAKSVAGDFAKRAQTDGEERQSRRSSRKTKEKTTRSR